MINEVFKFGKYQGEKVEDVAKKDIFYLIYIYWEIALSRNDDKRENMTYLEDIIIKNQHTIFDQKIYDVISFGKHKGKTFEDLYKNNIEYFWWLYSDNECKLRPDKVLTFTLGFIAKKNGCIKYNPDFKKLPTGANFCPACKTNHRR